MGLGLANLHHRYPNTICNICTMSEVECRFCHACQNSLPDFTKFPWSGDLTFPRFWLHLSYNIFPVDKMIGLEAVIIIIRLEIMCATLTKVSRICGFCGITVEAQSSQR
jgi:hypothetical protein